MQKRKLQVFVSSTYTDLSLILAFWEIENAV